MEPSEGFKLPIDMALTALRYGVFAYCVQKGFSADATAAYADFAVALGTLAWGFHASNYWTRFRNWLRGSKA